MRIKILDNMSKILHIAVAFLSPRISEVPKAQHDRDSFICRLLITQSVYRIAQMSVEFYKFQSRCKYLWAMTENF